jgi:SAM-dependent methyltransferase
MGAISYDPIKNRFAGFIRNSKGLRRIFYFILDLLFLRSWHIRRILKREGGNLDQKGKWKLLDAGSGFGQYDRFLLSRFKNLEILAIDVKEDYLEDCRHYFQKEIGEGRIEFKRLDLLTLNLPQEFDFILCVDVLEHIEEDQKVIQNLADSLKPGGQLLMHAPSHYSEEDADEGDSFVGEHARPGYSKLDISKKFEDAGVSVAQTHYTYGAFGHIAWVMLVKFPMLLLNKIGMSALLLLLIYYPVILIPALLLNGIDLITENSKGNGIYASGKRVNNNK